MKDRLQLCVTVCVLIGLVLSGITYFAKASDVDQLAFRLEQKIINDRVFAIKQRLWQLEDWNKGRPISEWTNRDRNEYRRLMEQIKLEERKLRK